jgi:hypothetical protein
MRPKTVLPLHRQKEKATPTNGIAIEKKTSFRIVLIIKKKRTMKNFKAIAAMLLLSISSTLTFTSCQDDTVDENKQDAQEQWQSSSVRTK